MSPGSWCQGPQLGWTRCRMAANFSVDLEGANCHFCTWSVLGFWSALHCSLFWGQPFYLMLKQEFYPHRWGPSVFSFSNLECLVKGHLDIYVNSLLLVYLLQFSSKQEQIFFLRARKALFFLSFPWKSSKSFGRKYLEKIVCTSKTKLDLMGQ